VTLWKRKPPFELPLRIKSVRRTVRDRRMRIDLVFYRDTVKRYLRITNERLRHLLKMPRTTTLSDVKRPVAIDQLILDAQRELALLAGRVPTRSATTSLGGREVTRFKEVGGTVTTPTLERSPVKEREPVTVTGTLCGFGHTQRALNGKSINQYYIDIKIDVLNGETSRFWGADLERAIREANAENGDSITLRQHGTVPCIVPEEITNQDGTKERTTRKTFKNAYVIQKLGSTNTAGADIHAQRH